VCQLTRKGEEEIKAINACQRNRPIDGQTVKTAKRREMAQHDNNDNPIFGDAVPRGRPSRAAVPPSRLFFDRPRPPVVPYGLEAAPPAPLWLLPLPLDAVRSARLPAS
jgi:hypothetical protein